MKRSKEVFGNKTARRMAAFWPGIGKHEVKCSHGISREQPLDGGGNLKLKDARIRQAVALDLSTGGAHSTQQSLDPQKVAAGILAGDGREKRAVAAPKVDLEGGAAPVNLFEIERCETIARDEFHLAC